MQQDDKTQQPIKIIKAAHLVTADEQGNCFSPGAIALKGAEIVAVGSPESVEAKVSSVTGKPHVIEYPNEALMPGLINSHAHSGMSLFRGMADDLPLMTWLQSHIWPAEAAWISEAFVCAGTRLAIAEMLLSGTTAFTDMYFFPELVAQTAHSAGMRVQLACPLLDFPTPWGSGPDEYLEKIDALLNDYGQPAQLSDLVHVGIGPHAPYTVSDAPLQRAAALADKHNTFIQMHVHETAHEVSEAVEKSGQRPLNRLHQLGLLGPHFQAVHFTQASPADIELAAETGISVIHCPESNLKLASGFTPTQAFINAGVNVALGTDGAASNNDLDMFSELRSASLLAKAVSLDASALPAATALKLPTQNAATALGRAKQLGTLQEGSAADIISVKLDEPNVQPLYQIKSQLAYALNSHQVQNVWIAGNQVVKNRQLLTLDLTEILAETDQWREKIAQA